MSILRKTNYIFIPLLSIFLVGCSSYLNKNINNLDINKNIPIQKNIEIQIAALGDVMVHKTQLTAQYNTNNDTYSFDNNFSFIKPYIENADLSLANLETTLRGKPYTSYPQFSSPDELIHALKNCGFDIISTINNHTSDTGKQGIERTLEVIKSNNLLSIGTRESSSINNYLIQDISGIKVGIVAYSYGEVSDNSKALNGIPIHKDLIDLVNVIDSSNPSKAFDTIKQDLDLLNSENPDIVLTFIHWGEEYMRTPNEFQTSLAQKLCDYGVDIILGSHPHVVQPIEILKPSTYSSLPIEDQNSHETFVVYSMGNAISNQRKELLNKNFTEDGLIVLLNITKDPNTNITTIKSLDYIPTWVNKYFNSSIGKNVYEILPYVENSPYLNTLNEAAHKKLFQSYQNTLSIMPKSNRIRPLQE